MKNSSAKDYEDEIKWGKGKGAYLSIDAVRLIEATSDKKPPQAIFKVVSQSRGHRVRKVLDYVSRSHDGQKEDLEMETEDGEIITGKEEVKELHNEWKESFERAKPGTQRPPRHATHMIFSADCEHTDKNAAKVRDCARDLLKEQFGDKGYRYGFVLHNDSGHLHVHVVVNNYHRDRGPKLRTNKVELETCRRQFSEKLNDRGLVHQATRKLDRPDYWKNLPKQLQFSTGKEEHHTRMMHRFNPEPKSFAQAQNMDRTVNKLIDLIDTDKSISFMERQGRVHQLRGVRKNLRKLPVTQVREMASGTVEELEKQSAHYKKHVAELRNPSAELPKLSKKDFKERQKTIEKMGKIQLYRIDKVTKEIKEKLPAGESRAIVKRIKEFRKTISNELDRSRGR